MNYAYLLTENPIGYKELLEVMNSDSYRDDDAQIYICKNHAEPRFLIAEHVDHFTNNEDIQYLNDNFEWYWNKITKRQSFKIFTDLDKLYPLNF